MKNTLKLGHYGFLKTPIIGGDPFCGMKPQWFYFSQGNGQFWNMGETSYCYSYVDIFLNAPMGIGHNQIKGQNKPVGWTNGFSSCTDKIPFPPGAGSLGYDIENPTQPTEHDYNNPVYSMLLILEYLSRCDIPGSCLSNTKKCSDGTRDPRTGMIGLGFCTAGPDGTCPCENETDKIKCLNKNSTNKGCGPDQAVNSRGDAMNEQVASLMGLRKGTYWKPYAVHGINNSIGLNKAPGISGTINQYGGYDPTDAWAKVRVKNKKPEFPVRSNEDKTIIKDNRYYVTGWVNGNFYGYPKLQFLDENRKIPNPYPEGMFGNDPVTGKKIYGKKCTKDDPLIYYGMDGKEIYRTWYDKQLNLNENTALLLMSEMYSCGDTGYESFNYNWPFGCYFGFGQALGGPGKNANQALSCAPYSCTSCQFTCISTAYGGIVQPAYDFEILYMAPIKSTSSFATCVCATAVTLDITADFNSDRAGEDLKRYLCLNKGSMGGYVPRKSPAGATAVAFQGQNMKVTNWTTIEEKAGTFDPYKKNKYNVDSNPSKLNICMSVPDYRKNI